MLRPFNDLVMIKLDKDGQFGSVQQGAETGIVEAVPERLMYLGFHSFAWENSFGAWDQLQEYLNIYKKLIGRRVYWSSMSERGSVITYQGEKYAFIKFTDILADDDAEADIAINIYGESGGTFQV